MGERWTVFSLVNKPWNALDARVLVMPSLVVDKVNNLKLKIGLIHWLIARNKFVSCFVQ